MIDRANYFERIKEISFSQLPEALMKGHNFIDKATESGANMAAFENENIRRVVDTYLEKLNKHLEEQGVPTKAESARHEKEPRHEQTTRQRKERKPRQPRKKSEPSADQEEDIEWVERIPDEIRFIRRFLSMHEKRKSKEDFLRFINALHRAIIEKKVRKSSPYARQIEYIQENLLKIYNEMKKPLTVKINDKTIAEFKAVIASEKVMPSVMLIKRYINLNGKFGVKEKAEKLMTAMERAAAKRKVLKTDKYADILNKMFNNLNRFVKTKSQKILNIQQTELNGLNGVLEDCGCQPVGELDGLPSPVEQLPSNNDGVVSSMEFRNVKFRTLGFTGKYRQLIGDPSEGFTAMVYGKPKMGKSHLCVDFAGYLARKHGKVLYVAREEGLDRTLQDKLKSKDVAHANLFVAANIPSDLTPYKFIFLDSVNKLGLSAGDLEALKQGNPGKSFIYVFQSTKEGNFRGANEFQHDVDVVIEVPEKGMAVQNGRFNQGGEMKIFP
jgi:hypothetical protein